MPTQRRKPKHSRKGTYLIAALFTYILIATGFFRQFGEAQREALQNNFGHALFFSVAAPQGMAGLTESVQRYFMEVITSIEMNRMLSLVGDGMGFGGLVRARERVVPMEPDGYRFVRRHNLIYGMEDFEENPRPEIHGEAPLILLYNTHTWERFGDHQTSVMNMAEIMRDTFEGNGIPTFMEHRSVEEYLNRDWGPLMADHAYEQSRIFVEERIHQFPSLMFFFDIHRDGGAWQPWTTINGEDYARIMFVISPENPYFRNNVNVVEEVVGMLEAKRPGIMRNRPVSVQHGGPFHTSYNQDISQFLMLIEIGDETTPPHAAANSARILAEVLSEFIWQQDLSHLD